MGTGIVGRTAFEWPSLTSGPRQLSGDMAATRDWAPWSGREEEWPLVEGVLAAPDKG